jgi:hypothetical protein
MAPVAVRKVPKVSYWPNAAYLYLRPRSKIESTQVSPSIQIPDSFILKHSELILASSKFAVLPALSMLSILTQSQGHYCTLFLVAMHGTVNDILLHNSIAIHEPFGMDV